MTTDLDTVLAAIDDVAHHTCGTCDRPLPADGPSRDFCGEHCQLAWTARQAEALVGYREPLADWLTDVACPVDGPPTATFTLDNRAAVFTPRTTTDHADRLASAELATANLLISIAPVPAFDRDDFTLTMRLDGQQASVTCPAGFLTDSGIQDSVLATTRLLLHAGHPLDEALPGAVADVACEHHRLLSTPVLEQLVGGYAVGIIRQRQRLLREFRISDQHLQVSVGQRIARALARHERPLEAMGTFLGMPLHLDATVARWRVDPVHDNRCSSCREIRWGRAEPLDRVPPANSDSGTLPPEVVAMVRQEIAAGRRRVAYPEMDPAARFALWTEDLPVMSIFGTRELLVRRVEERWVAISEDRLHWVSGS
jgi:hypothetical protein